MKKLGLFAAALVAATSMAAPAANAAGCGANGQPALGQISIGDGNAGTIYIDDRNYALGNGLWIYLEDNGLNNLQRGGESIMGRDLGGADDCVESDNPDQVIF